MGFGTTLEKILDSYNAQDDLSLDCAKAFPDRHNVILALEDLQSVIFPGFTSPELMAGRNIRFVTGQKLNEIVYLLTKEIQDSLIYISKMDSQGRGAAPTSHCFALAEKAALALIQELPQIRGKLIKDALAVLKGDPAAKSLGEVIICYPGLQAILVHRIAHFLYKNGIPVIPRVMSEHIHSKTGIDIHPGAQIGESFFIDHGTGIVIGETCVIGCNVKVYQGVTLGALSVQKDMQNKKRHPTIEDDVTIYAGATILGGDTVIGKGSVIGGNTWLTKSVAPYTTVIGQKHTEHHNTGQETFTFGAGI